MAKKTQKPKKKPKSSKKQEPEIIMDDKEYKNGLYFFIVLFVGAIVFLAIYLIGLINILIK